MHRNRAPLACLALATLFLAPDTRPLRAEDAPPKPAVWTDYKTDAHEKLLREAPAPAGAGFRLLLKSEVFQKADKVSYMTVEGDPSVQRVLIVSDGKKWVYYPPTKDRDGVIIDITNASGELMYLLKKDGDKTVLVPVDKDVRVQLPASRGQNAVSGAGGGKAGASGLLAPGLPAKLIIAPEDAPESAWKNFDYHWKGTKLLKADGTEVGYKTAGVDTIFFHNGAKPGADGTHADQDKNWALYGMNGQKLGDYAALDLIRTASGKPTNIVTVKKDSEELRRLRLETVDIKESESAAPDKLLGTHKGFQFLEKAAASGKALSRYVDLEGVLYVDKEVSPGKMIVSKDYSSPLAGLPNPSKSSDGQEKGAWTSFKEWVVGVPRDVPADKKPAADKPLDSRNVLTHIATLRNVSGASELEARKQAAQILAKEAQRQDAPAARKALIAKNFKSILESKREADAALLGTLREALKALESPAKS